MEYPIFYTDIEQNTPEWDKIRLGKITASPAESLLVGGEKLGSGSLTYARLKAAEIIEGRAVLNPFSNIYTEIGHESEQLARMKYETDYFVDVEQVGFVQSSKYVGCSPDGVMRSRKTGVEFKCFRGDNHINFIDLFDQLEKGSIPLWSNKKGEKSFLDKAKFAQLQFSMMVTGFDSWDLVFYNPRNYNDKCLIVKRIMRDEETIELFRRKVILLIAEIERLVSLVDASKIIQYENDISK